MFNKNDVRNFIKSEHKNIIEKFQKEYLKSEESTEEMLKKFEAAMEKRFNEATNVIDHALQKKLIEVANIDINQKFSASIEYKINDLISIKNLLRIISDYSSDYNLTMRIDEDILSHNQVLNWKNYNLDLFFNKKFELSLDNPNIDYILKNQSTSIKNIIERTGIKNVIILTFESNKTIREILMEDDQFNKERINEKNRRIYSDSKNPFGYHYFSKILL